MTSLCSGASVVMSVRSQVMFLKESVSIVKIEDTFIHIRSCFCGRVIQEDTNSNIYEEVVRNV